MMALTDLTDRNRQVVQVLRERKIASRVEISDCLKRLTADQVSTNLNRLELFGLVEKPESRNGCVWAITPAGLALFDEPQPSADSESTPAPVEAGPDIDPATPDDADFSPETPEPLLAQMALDAEVDAVVARLWLPSIPAQSARVYRRLVAELPEAVRLALDPITAMVES